MHDTQGRDVFNLLVNEFTRIYDMKISFNVIHVFPYGLKHCSKRFCSFVVVCLFVLFFDTFFFFIIIRVF